MQASEAPLTEGLARWRASLHVHHPEGSARLYPTLGTHPESLASALVVPGGLRAPRRRVLRHDAQSFSVRARAERGP